MLSVNPSEIQTTNADYIFSFKLQREFWITSTAQITLDFSSLPASLGITPLNTATVKCYNLTVMTNDFCYVSANQVVLGNIVNNSLHVVDAGVNSTVNVYYSIGFRLSNINVPSPVGTYGPIKMTV